jgi:hypothetical protein
MARANNGINTDGKPAASLWVRGCMFEELLNVFLASVDRNPALVLKAEKNDLLLPLSFDIPIQGSS